MKRAAAGCSCCRVSGRGAHRERGAEDSRGSRDEVVRCDVMGAGVQQASRGQLDEGRQQQLVVEQKGEKREVGGKKEKIREDDSRMKVERE